MGNCLPIPENKLILNFYCCGSSRVASDQVDGLYGEEILQVPDPSTGLIEAGPQDQSGFQQISSCSEGAPSVQVQWLHYP